MNTEFIENGQNLNGTNIFMPKTMLGNQNNLYVVVRDIILEMSFGGNKPLPKQHCDNTVKQTA